MKTARQAMVCAGPEVVETQRDATQDACQKRIEAYTGVTPVWLACASTRLPTNRKEIHIMSISRHATAHWEGDLKSGKGQLSTPQSGLMDKVRYGFNSRFGDEKGTNPEELIAAAHAGCFTMALSAKLTEAGHPPTRIDTRAQVDLSMEGGPSLSQIRLQVEAQVPGIDDAKFQSIAKDAEKNCPVSKALSAVPISMEATLRS
jgi:osmotically inducible protein OsmC